MANKNQVAKIILLLSTLPNYPDRETELMVEAYHIVLKDIDWETLQAATAQYLSTGTFFPAPGQLRQTVLELRLRASGIPTAAEAWADVLGAVRHVQLVNCPEGASPAGHVAGGRRCQ